MAYIVPSVLINQEFTQVPVFTTQPLSALIIGPQYNLYRYAVAAEKQSTLLGAYVSGSDTPYNFPSQVAGTFVDGSYVEVFFEDAVASFFPNALASTSGAVTRLAIPNTANYYTNRFKATSLVFATANSVNRSIDFANRDVAPGDLVTIHSPSTSITQQTKVKALYPSYSASVIGTATDDAGNTPTQSESHAGSVTPVVTNGSVVTVSNTSTAYKGSFNYLSGAPIIADTYKGTVTTAGDHTAVRFTVTSANGAFAPVTAVALSSYILALDTNSPNVVHLDFTGSTSFAVGDSWAVTVAAPVVATVVPTTAGTYTGPAALTSYKLTVVRGGKFFTGSNASTCARVSVTSNNIDSSATVNVTISTPFVVGNYGVTASFASGPLTGALLTGDVYYIPVTAAAPTGTNVIETYDVLPITLSNGSTVDWTITDISLVTNYQVNQAIPGDDVDVNWVVADQVITINDGISAYDPGLVNGSDLLTLPVSVATVYVQHRDLVTSNSVAIGSVTTTDEITTVLGTVDPDNPLAQGVYNATLNSNGVSVYYAALQTNDLSGYNYALGLAKKTNTYYGLVPLTFDSATQEAVVAHVNALSTASAAQWRVAWLSVPAAPTALIYNTKSNTDPWEGTITDDTLTAGTQYTLLTITGATFITNGIRTTDQVFINFRVDSTGTTVYDTYTVSEVRTQTTLVLVSGPAAAIASPTKVQIQRSYTTSEQAATLASIAGSYANRRVRVVFPDNVKNGTVVQEGYQVAAALAGLRSGVVPQQGLTNVQVLGFTDLTESVVQFTADDLNTLAASGVWIVTQSVVGATPYVRHQLTSDQSSLNTSEDSITTNVDSISYGLQAELEPFIGVYNINPTTIDVITAAIDGQLNFRLTQTFTARAGNQLTSYKILSVAQDPLFFDRINVSVQLGVPYPLNFVVITLLV